MDNNVIKDMADVYYDRYKDLSKDLKKHISIYMLDVIFKKMVKPTLNKMASIDSVTIYELEERLIHAEKLLEKMQYRRCDAAACNCGSYHFVPDGKEV